LARECGGEESLSTAEVGLIRQASAMTLQAELLQTRIIRAALPTVAGTCLTTLYEYDGPIVELKRVNRFATWRLNEKVTEVLLRLMSFGNPLLE
jgi:hypothetical protein